MLLLSGGTRVKIEDIHIEKLLKPEIKYNFEVEDFHTYYVTESEILVHNMCSKDNIVKTGNAKHSEIYDTFDEAFARAKELAGVSDDELISITQARDKAGRFMSGKHYNYERVNRAGRKVKTTILHHSAGHPNYGMTPHLNVQSKVGGIKYHIFYRGF